MKDGVMIYILLVLSILFVLFFAALIIRMDNKKQIHYAVLMLTSSVIIWDTAVLLGLIFIDTRLNVFFEQLYFLGPILVSIAVLFLGLTFAHNRIVFTRKLLLIFIPPMISVAALFTNHYHHLFYTTFSHIPSEQDFGIFFVLHSIFSYTYIGIGLIYLVVFSLKNYGFFSRQSLLIFLGILISLIFDSFSTLKIYNWPTYFENLVFTLSIACFMFAVVKYHFLHIIPIAYKIIVDSLTDCYVVIDDNYGIIDYNKAFEDMFSKIQPFKRKGHIMELLRKYHIDPNENIFFEHIEASVKQKISVGFELAKTLGEKDYYHRIEVIPIYRNNRHAGTIILIRDITESKNHLNQITALNNKLQNLAIRDGLTKAYNRYFFDERLQQEMDRIYKQQNYGQKTSDNVSGFGLIIFDIDFFKAYNDNNGHLAGDELLQTLVKVVQTILFPTDILCRYGGEEFVVICCDTSAEGTAIVAEKIRKIVESHEFKHQEKQPGGNLTISVGATHCSAADMKKEKLINKADANLYAAKTEGRNKAVFK